MTPDRNSDSGVPVSSSHSTSHTANPATEQQKGSVQTVKKKRSLSSYLSNVNSRKEELIRIAQREKEEAERKLREEEERKRKAEEEQRRRDAEEMKAREERERKLREEQEREIQANIERKIREEQARQEQKRRRLQLLQRQKEKEEAEAKAETVSVKTEKTETLAEIARSYDDIKSTRLFGNSLQYPFDTSSLEYRMRDSGRIISRGVWQYIAPYKSFSRDLLKSLLQEPGLPNLFQETEDCVSPAKLKEGDIESDAETVVVASPVRGKRKRLVRGDELASSSQTNLSRDLSVDNVSEDSELSNIEDDARRTPLWNIFLDENYTTSSPGPAVLGTGQSNSAPQTTHQESQPDLTKINSSPERKPEKESPSLTPRTPRAPYSTHTSSLSPSASSPSPPPPPALPPARRKSYIATIKSQKQRKSVYRDAGGRTKLQIACDKGQIDTVKRLLQEGEIDINDQDNAGNTSLHEAALNGHLDIVKLLVEHGANVNIQSYEMFRDTPLIDASANGHLDVIEYLLKHGADPTLTNSKGMTAYEAIEDDSDLDESERELVKDIKNCLREYTKRWNRSHDNKSIGIGSGSASGQRKTSIMSRDRLVSSETNDITDGGSAEAKVYAADDEIQFIWSDIASKAGKEKLMRAAKEGILSYVGTYLENGGKVDFKCFIEAVKFGHSEVVSLFLAFGAPVNGTTKDNVTPLMIAVGRDHLSTVKLLLEAGANVLLKDKNGHDALYYAKNSILGIETHAEKDMIREAMAKATGRDISEVDSGRRTPVLAKTRTNENGFLRPSSSIGVSKERYKDANGTTKVKSEPTTESPSMGIDKEHSEEDEDKDEQIIVPSRRRTGSPTGIKRKNTSTPINTIQNESKRAKITRQNSIDNLNDEEATKMAHDETAEEREQRLKNTEEYLQKKLQTKKKREQELLHKLQEDDKKKEEEKARQKLEEEKREQEARRQKELRETEEKREIELTRRRKIRSLYPLGLKLINFNDKNDNIEEFLPLYYMVNGEAKEKFVLDLQIITILKSDDSLKGLHHSLDVDEKDKEQLWNVLKFIFLYGGRNNYQYEEAIQGLGIDARIDYEAKEFSKFSSLPMRWVRLDEIIIEDEHIRKSLTSNMVEIALNSNQTPRGNAVEAEGGGGVADGPLPQEWTSPIGPVAIGTEEVHGSDHDFLYSTEPRHLDNIWAMAPASERLLPIKFRQRPSIVEFILRGDQRQTALSGKDHSGRSAGGWLW